MMYNTREYWVRGLCPSSVILKSTVFRKLNLVLSLGEGLGDICSVGSNRKI
jgi:hypothetical protein